MGQYGFREPTSCEINFPSFEIAHDSYYKLRDGFELGRRTGAVDDDEGPFTINWMRTPSDARLYWTRDIGFD
jgi:hypothetical protein